MQSISICVEKCLRLLAETEWKYKPTTIVSTVSASCSPVSPVSPPKNET